MAANGHAKPMKRKIVIQSAFDLENTGNIEHMVYASDFPEAPMNFHGMEFLTQSGELHYSEKPPC